MSTDISKSTGMANADEYYILTNGRATHYAQVHHPYATLDKVYVGGKKRCACFSVYVDEDDDSEEPNLDAVGYDADCNVAGDMLRGSGTKQMMLVAFAFLRWRYPRASHKIVLRDKSKIACRRGDMYLSSFYVLHYGQTWYQRHFDAYPYQESLRAPLRTAIEDLSRYKRTKPDAEDVFGRVKGEGRRRALLEVYREERSLGSFLRTIKDRDCDIYAQWGERLIDQRLPFLVGMEWCIDTDRLSLPFADEDLIVRSLGSDRPPGMFGMTR